MPPHPLSYDGIDAIAPAAAPGLRAADDGRLAPRAHARQPPARGRQLPARARRLVYRAFKLDVLRVEDGAIAEITTFNSDLFAAFGLAETL